MLDFHGLAEDSFISCLYLSLSLSLSLSLPPSFPFSLSSPSFSPLPSLPLSFFPSLPPLSFSLSLSHLTHATLCCNPVQPMSILHLKHDNSAPCVAIVS